MNASYSYPYNYQDNRIPRYGNFMQDSNYSNYRRDKDNFLNSLNNNISTSLSSYDKYNDNKNINRIQYNRNNNILNSSLDRSKNKSRSRSPCSYGCHSNEKLYYIPKYHCIPVYHYDNSYNQNTNSFITKNEEMNRKNNDLLNEIIQLKRNLNKVEDELKRTKTEKDACDFYIKELERELSKSNMNNIINNNSNKPIVNSVKMRDFGKYHDMLNKSFEVLDSVSNKCNDPHGKTKGGVNYYFDRDKDYNLVVDTQKKWIDNLPENNKNINNYINNNSYNDNDTFKESDPINTNNKLGNNGYQDDSKLNIFKYPEGYKYINDQNNNNNNKTQLSNDSIYIYSLL